MGLLPKLLEVFRGVLFELLDAGLAAEADFLVAVGFAEGFSHAAEFVVGHDAGFEGVALWLGRGGKSVWNKAGEGGNGGENDGDGVGFHVGGVCGLLFVRIRVEESEAEAEADTWAVVTVP